VKAARKIRFAVAAIMAVAGVTAAAPASATTYVPPAGQVYLGDTDTRSASDFSDFAGLLGKPHLPITQAFHVWGTNPNEAVARWQGYDVRGVLSISTADGFGLPGKITPQQIALGDGDDYLLTLNRELAKTPAVTYVRPLAEMNNGNNAYSATTAYGGSRGSGNAQTWYKRAWRRMSIVIKGGQTVAAANARLAALGLPPIQQKGKAAVPATLAAPRVALIWCPLVYGSPRTSAQSPIKYWPGAAWVDWVATDTYSKYQAWSSMNRFYKAFKGKPFAIGEWGVWDADDAGFVNHLFRWQRHHKRVRMMIYHMSFAGRSGPMSLFRWPRAAAATRFQVRGSAYPPYAPL
jgi:hypothetical protein